MNDISTNNSIKRFTIYLKVIYWFIIYRDWNYFGKSKWYLWRKFLYLTMSKNEYQIEIWIITFVNFQSFLTTKWGIQDINWFCLLKLSRNKLKSMEEMNEYFFAFCLITRVDGEKMWLTHPNNVITEDTSMLWGDNIISSRLQ